jgi:hypothetical protein
MGVPFARETNRKIPPWNTARRNDTEIDFTARGPFRSAMPDSEEPEQERAGESVVTEHTGTPPSPATDSMFEQARTLLEQGRSELEVKQMLMGLGLDEESARVLVNSLPGAIHPSALPEPTVSLSTNALVPDLFSLGELGLSGDPATVGLYWLVFSVVLLAVLLFVMFVPVPELFDDKGPSDAFLFFVDVVLPPVGFGLVGGAFARGAYLFVRGRRFKLTRKTK